MKELTSNIRYEFRTPAGMHKEYLDNLVHTFGIHWIAHHREAHGWDCDTVEICKQDSRGVLSVSLYEGSRHVNQEFCGDTVKELVTFMSGFIHGKQWLSLKREETK